ncbi:Sorbitol dehydrogenase [Eumeta japonica]|uniref:Sorbitol dehydrogenase n=1 Tax=Eumeta variegata TaxID=151549 RepID=A0A4C1X4V1_EUMVA|nr:Sorbitol dehydrogenase [Eumeta japonica]
MTRKKKRSESLTDVELRPSQPQLTLKEKLQLEIDKSMKSPDPEIQVQNESGMTNSIRCEMSLFENGGVRGYLETAYKYPIALSLVARGLINVKPLVTHHFSIEETVQAYEVARQAKGIKVMIHVQPRDQNNPNKF